MFDAMTREKDEENEKLKHHLQEEHEKITEKNQEIE